MTRFPLLFSLMIAAVLAAATSRAGAADPASPPPGAAEPSTRPEIYGQGVRETPWLSPEDELAGFHLPPGFEARLFAAEPHIAKPLNMAFDAKGRMWLTQSVEYPYPAKEGTTPRDAVMVLEDTDRDGKADQVTTFADQLNIPIGVLPYGDGCICFSIPNLLYLRDTDGDGRCDQREVILGPFDTTRDTHGMINALRDGGDGWIYACHGFNNQSEVAGRDGHVVTMHSGNTFRFRPDGSRIEHVTYGQVNPFGMTEDRWGYRYSADCHSKPITQLIFGACYPSFGRPHDGLGFLPPMVDHLHGSTAICGILYYPEESPVVPLRGQMISGNVMTSRINRNQVVYEGATAKGIELPDFMTSDDPWFRPVDLQLGPDGHLYIADFYNKIIGHYEVPLNHPERDRTSGRIWQIRYRSADDVTPTRVASSDVEKVDPLDQDVAGSLRIQALQKRFARGDAGAETIATMAKADRYEPARVAAMRLAAEAVSRQTPNASMLVDIARNGLRDTSPHFIQASAELLGKHGSTSDVERLLATLAEVPDSDTVLLQTCRIAIRNLLADADDDAEIWSGDAGEPLASILLGLKRPEVSNLLLGYLSDHPDAPQRNEMLAHAARHSPSGSIDQCVRVAKRITSDDPVKQQELIGVLIESQNARPGQVAPALRSWALEVVDRKLRKLDNVDPVLGWSTDDGGVWPPESRQLRKGNAAMLVSSLGRGESYTGRRISDPFPAPKRITFWLAGHNGFPDQPDHGKNRVRLVRAANGEVLLEASPPRNDVALKVDWNTEGFQGDLVRIECIDGDQASAYAWLALGQFEPAWLDEAGRAESLADALGLIRRLGLTEKEQQLRDLIDRATLASSLRQQVAQAIANLGNRKSEEIVARFCQSSGAPADLVDAAIGACLGNDPDAVLEPTKLLCKRLSLSDQVQFATEWSKSGADVDLLLKLIEWGWLSPSVLAGGDAAQAIAPRLSPDQQARVQAMTANLNIDEKQFQQLQQLQATISLAGADLARGQQLFAKNCANCHQLRGQGVVVGPQLDGAATRSVERLLEDIVTPDRNVDHAFRTTSFLLDDGRVVSGLVTSESPTEIVVVESTGKPVTIEVATVEQRRDAGRSLMPGNMGEVLSAEELRDLIRFVKSP